MESSMKVFLGLSGVLMVYIGVIAAGPIPGDGANNHLQSIQLRLDFLNNKVLPAMSSKLIKYESICRIAKGAERILNMAEFEESAYKSGFLIASQQMQDICEWMETRTLHNSTVNCTTAYSSIQTVSSLCDEISLTSSASNTDSAIQLALKAVESITGSNTTPHEQSQFASNFTQTLPEAIHGVICESLECADQ